MKRETSIGNWESVEHPRSSWNQEPDLHNISPLLVFFPLMLAREYLGGEKTIESEITNFSIFYFERKRQKIDAIQEGD